jgi:hypothetical protein
MLRCPLLLVIVLNDKINELSIVKISSGIYKWFFLIKTNN